MPRNFSYLIDGVLAGSGLPGLSRALMDDLRLMADEGITGLVTLTEERLPRAVVEEAGMKYLHVPIADFAAPTQQQARQVIDFIDEMRGSGGATALHCFAGAGRTGTLLAAYLIKEGATAEEAIARVRRARPGSIETYIQEQFLEDFEASRGE